jgi:hypothetical protein
MGGETNSLGRIEEVQFFKSIEGTGPLGLG